MQGMSRTSFSIHVLWSRGMMAVGLVFAVMLGACLASPEVLPRPEPVPPAVVGEERIVFVTSTGWHTGIVLAREDVPIDRIPEADDFPRAAFLEFGWGDAEFYPAKEYTIAMTLRAALLPTPAVLHVAALDVSPDVYFPEADVVPLALDPRGLSGLIDYIAASFDRGTGKRANVIGPGLHRNSLFYPATGTFHIGNTCNTWTANALRAGGLPLSGVTRADDLLYQIRPPQ